MELTFKYDDNTKYLLAAYALAQIWAHDTRLGRSLSAEALTLATASATWTETTTTGCNPVEWVEL